MKHRPSLSGKIARDFAPPCLVHWKGNRAHVSGAVPASEVNAVTRALGTRQTTQLTIDANLWHGPNPVRNAGSVFRLMHGASEALPGVAQLCQFANGPRVHWSPLAQEVTMHTPAHIPIEGAIIAAIGSQDSAFTKYCFTTEGLRPKDNLLACVSMGEAIARHIVREPETWEPTARLSLSGLQRFAEEQKPIHGSHAIEPFAYRTMLSAMHGALSMHMERLLAEPPRGDVAYFGIAELMALGAYACLPEAQGMNIQLNIHGDATRSIMFLRDDNRHKQLAIVTWLIVQQLLTVRPFRRHHPNPQTIDIHFDASPHRIMRASFHCSVPSLNWADERRLHSREWNDIHMQLAAYSLPGLEPGPNESFYLDFGPGGRP